MHAYWTERLRPYNLPPDITALPTILLTDRDQLPNEAAVYFVLLDQGTVMYIGHTKTLRQRWKNHHHIENFIERKGMRIAWMSLADPRDGSPLESYLIHHFNPPCNLSGSPLFAEPRWGCTAKMTREELALIEDFARQLSDEALGFPYRAGDALRIAALRYLRDSRYPK